MFSRKQKIINGIVSKRNSYFAITIYVLLLFGSFACKKSTPNSNDQIESINDNSPFIMGKGVQVTFDNDAGVVAWISDSSNISYTSLIVQGSTLSGKIKAVDIRNNKTTVLDSTLRYSNSFYSVRDTIFNVALNRDNSSGIYIISNCLVTPKISIFPYPLLGDEYFVTISPDSKKILLTSGRILNLSDGSSTNVSMPTQFPRWINWNANGLQVLTFTQDSIQEYFVKDLLSGVSKKVWQSGTDDKFGFQVAWSPDGKKIAFLRETPMNISPTEHYIYLCDVASSSAKKVVAVKVRLKDSILPGIWSFAFSQNSKRFAYSVEGNIYFLEI
ncbi:MAG: hypothetical protein WDA22_15305 [Bacteroidota bacterium]